MFLNSAFSFKSATFSLATQYPASAGMSKLRKQMAMVRFLPNSVCFNMASISKFKDPRAAFVMIVLAVHFIGEVISNKRKGMGNNNADEGNETVIHPAEFNMR